MTLLHRYEEVPLEAGLDHGDILAHVEYDIPEDAEWDLIERRYYERVPIGDRLGTLYHEDGRSTFCRHCGTTTPHVRGEWFSAEDVREHALNLSDTYDTLGIEHDRDILIETAVACKRNPDTAGHDSRCFRQATAAAIRAVR